MSSSVEKILRVFGSVKSVKFNDDQPATIKIKKSGGMPLLQRDEKIALVGNCWKKSPIGWQILFAEYTGDGYAKNKALNAASKKAHEILSGEHVIFADAVAKVAFEQVICAHGFICCVCSGTGVVKAANRHLKKCGCNGGRVKWSKEFQYARFVSVANITFKQFKKLDCYIVQLTEFLESEKLEAVQSCESELDLLKIEHEFVG